MTDTPAAKSQRPLSPHLQVYRPQITSMMSIFNRITGVALVVGAPLLVWWLAAAASGPRAFATVQDFLMSWVGLTLLFGWSFSFYYHLCNGIRHLIWDMGIGLELRQVYIGGWIALGASLGLTLLTWIVGVAAW